ncbi:MAG TPA: HIT domain-containing protein, partial [Acidimicrobiales bacterium]|nr:HIT domain-containing protein [Acidimicrobiales bacterium]
MSDRPRNELRYNPLTGRWVTIAAGRAERPRDFATRRLEVEPRHGRPCPFCPGHEDHTPHTLGEYGPPGAWQVRVVANLYPAFEGTAGMQVHQVGPLHHQAPASGVHEVLITARQHHTDWSELEDHHVDLVMTALADRIAEHATHPAVRYTQAIVNYGREAGASLEHPHAQVLGIPFVAGEIGDEVHALADTGPCLICRIVESEEDVGVRIVAADEHAVVISPFWAGAPYEMLVIPRHHVGSLALGDEAGRASVGRLLRDALGRLRMVLGDVAYNLVFHTEPHHHEGTFHWHVHVLPRTTTIAG